MSSRNRNRILLPSEPKKGPSLLWGFALLFVAPPVGTFFGIYLLLKRAKAEYSHRQWQDFKHYAAIIGDRSSVSIRELSTRLGKSTDEVIRDLQAMIDREILDPQCYIDRGAMLLYLQDDVIETHFVNPTVNIYVNDADNARVQTGTAESARPVGKHAGKPVEKPAEKPAEKPRPQPQPAKKNTLDDEDFEAKLREIRQLNDDIDNEAVSERIDRIGALTASIFRPEGEAELSGRKHTGLPQKDRGGAGDAGPRLRAAAGQAVPVRRAGRGDRHLRAGDHDGLRRADGAGKIASVGICRTKVRQFQGVGSRQ